MRTMDEGAPVRATGYTHPCTTHLDGHLGPEAWAQLMDDLCIEAATVVHVTYQHGKGLWGRGQLRGQRSNTAISLSKKPLLQEASSVLACAHFGPLSNTAPSGTAGL